jgi:hypothetical protein
MRSVFAGKALCPCLGFSVVLAATLHAGTWQIETVDQTGTAKYSSLKIDKHGNAHVAYVIDDGNRNPLKYGFWDRSLNRWFVMTVDQGVGICDLALDSKQRPHISYADFGSGSGTRLHYAYWDGTAWKKQALPLNSDSVSYYNSISLDPNDNPSISYYELRGPKGTNFNIRLRNVMRKDQQWELRTVDGVEGSGKFNSQAADAHGNIHIGYANVSAGTAGLRYAHWNGARWKVEIVEGLQTGGRVVGFSAYLTLDDSGNPHVAYSDQTAGFIKYAVRQDGRWRIEEVDRVGALGYPDRNSLALDDEGRPWIGYYDAARRVLKVAHREGQKWAPEIVDENNSGFTSSMQIDRGVLFISYTSDGGGLKLARRELRSTPAAATSQAMPPAGRQYGPR